MAAWWRLASVSIAICGFCLAGGCSSSSSDEDAEFADLELDEETSKILAAPSKTEAAEPAPLPELSDPPLKGELGLRLAVGDRFPLQKRVEQRLTAPNGQGQATGHTLLDLLLSLVVEELRDGQTRFGVRYHRVRYLEQDPEGNTIEYNSALPARDIPPQARVYAGMVDNGFSFWIGPDNRLVDLVGFSDFVQRCIRDIPANQRQAIVDQLSTDSSENGIASFIDDSIGLLPVSSDPKTARVTVQEGTSWELPARKFDGPAPMVVNTRCKIKGLSERTAEIDLFGSIAPANRSEKGQGWKVSVLGGRCMGSCTVDRTTGLPSNSRVERYVDLMLESPDGSQLTQRKEVITTIQAFLPTQVSSTGIRQISHSEEAPAAVNDSSSAAVEQPASVPSASRTPRPSSDELRLFR